MATLFYGDSAGEYDKMIGNAVYESAVIRQRRRLEHAPGQTGTPIEDLFSSDPILSQGPYPAIKDAILRLRGSLPHSKLHLLDRCRVGLRTTKAGILFWAFCAPMPELLVIDEVRRRHPAVSFDSLTIHIRVFDGVDLVAPLNPALVVVSP